MARILLAWELGSGLGHVRALTTLARALRERGHAIALAMPDPKLLPPQARDIALRLAPAFRSGTRNDIASYPEILVAHGWDRAERVAADLAIWESSLVDIDLVVANHAPGALLAAHALKLPRVAIGTGFTCPPDAVPMPCFRSWDPITSARLEASERDVRVAIGGALQQRLAPPIATLAEAFAQVPAALWTEAALDPYRPRANILTAGALGEAETDERLILPRRDVGTRVFAYLKWAHPATIPLLQALRARADATTVAFVAGIPAHGIASLSSASLQVVSSPLPLSGALAWCEVAICHGGATTTSAALAAGRALLLLPEVPEQFLTALAVHALGAGHWWVPASAEDEAISWPMLFERWLGDATMRSVAKAFGESVEGYRPERSRARLCAAIEAALI